MPSDLKKMDKNVRIAGLNPCSNGMPSDSFRFSQYRISQVLILVLMECPLTYLGIMIKLGLIVLILVLMECPLTKYHTAISGWYVVLILVLMECPLTNVDGKTCWSLRVLILVLMECPLTDSSTSATE